MANKRPLALYAGVMKELTAGDTATIAAAQLTGTAISFTQEAFYGTVAAPITGNITGVTTGALLGTVCLIVHNAATAPTFDSKFKKLSGSGSYVVNAVNLIWCMYMSLTEIDYFIQQRT